MEGTPNLDNLLTLNSFALHLNFKLFILLINPNHLVMDFNKPPDVTFDFLCGDGKNFKHIQFIWFQII